jgi:outer membrane protein assembly factor BamB
VLLQAADKLEARDAKTGDLVWAYEATCGDIASPTTDGDVVYLPSNGLTALRSSAGSGNWEKVWQEAQMMPSSPSPVVAGGKVFVVNRAGAMTCADAKTGDVLWRQRVKGPFWATPLAIGDLLYLVNADGLAQVVRAGAKSGEIVAEMSFGEPVLGSPAYAEGALYFRGEKHLWKIAQP